MLTFLYVALPILLTPSAGSLLPPVLAQVGASDDAMEQAPPEEGDVPPEEEPAPLPQVEVEPEADPVPRPVSSLASQLQQRAEIRDIHRAFGIATWISLAGTVVLGGLQIRDEYGPFASGPGSTPCDVGDAYLGSCYQEFPVAHAVSAIVSSVLYYTTFTLSFFMPDPLDSASSPGWAGERIRIHKTLRWLHFAGMVITSLFGAVTANLPYTADNFSERQALAITHFALGATTFALLSAAAIVILF